MARDFTLVFDDTPGELARLGETAGAAGVNLQGLAAFTGDGKGFVHALVGDDAADAFRRAMQQAGMGVADEREVLVIDLKDRPGTLGEATRQLADAGVNIDLAYTTFGGVKLVIATEDIASARAALGS
ncbi:MAG: amino acid-binding protein [Candidatus Dormibacteraeota bacterium]|nr:amino acid-binding protein [Candidatus Dormibacteraeota bacterium]